jgi:hypothetical protein
MGRRINELKVLIVMGSQPNSLDRPLLKQNKPETQSSLSQPMYNVNPINEGLNKT